MNGVNRRRFLLPRSRRLTTDVLFFHRRVPMCPHSRVMDLAELNAVRCQTPRRISLAAVFIRAYGLMAAEFPVFRQMYYRWPLATVYQHDKTVLMMAIARECRGEPWLCWGRFIAPEDRSLPEIQQQIERYQSEPVERAFRQQYQLSGLPMPLRRILWWCNLNGPGATRARRTGTAFLSTLAGQGAEIASPPSFQTGCVTYGPVDEAGRTRVTLSYDHRLMDGLIVARCLERFEEILSQTMVDELLGLMELPGQEAA